MWSRIKMPLMATVLAAFMFCISGPAIATTWDAAADFSSASNPNSVWTYGYSSALVGAVTTYNNPTTITGLNWWDTAASPLEIPAVFKNSTGATINAFSSVNIPAGALAFHPGAGGIYSVYGLYSNIMWTAPATGKYVINATFNWI